MENLKEFIKSRKRNRIYRYSIRRLSIGVASCIVGTFVIFSPVNFGKIELSGVVYAQNRDKYNKEAEREKSKLDKFLKYDANTGEITFNIEIDYDKVRITNDGGVRAGEFIKSNSGFEGIEGVEYKNNKWIITRDYYGNSKKVKVEVLKKKKMGLKEELKMGLKEEFTSKK